MKLDFEVKIIEKVLATNFVQKYHYSPVMPSITKYYLGFYLGGELKGVLTLGWGTRPRHTFNKMFPDVGILDKIEDEVKIKFLETLFPEELKKPKNSSRFVHDINDWYYEIGKMCLSKELNGDAQAGSQMVSATIRWLKTNTNCQFLYTMADGIMGKCGFVYQASNFYFGEQYFTSVYLMENGEKLHPRTSKNLCIENAKFIGKDKVFWLTMDFMKSKGIRRIDGLMFRYLYPLNKKAKKMMKKSSMDWDKNYPKEENLEWVDVTDKKNKEHLTEQPDFTFKNAKYNLKNINAHKST
jgi:hypothetical protein